jgi:signal transduction histidine kinase
VAENLLSNAIKYSPAGGEITISIRREPAPRGHVLDHRADRSPRRAPAAASSSGAAGTTDTGGATDTIGPAGATDTTGAPAAWAVLAVHDEGVGIPAADLRRVFERYHRSRNVAGAVPGMGIGLAGARRIVEQHGGTIAVESVEGKGSTFTVRLPLAPASQQPAAELGAA